VLVIAHRTLPRDAPENSLAGIRLAAGAGADAVEVDVRRTADGVPVLLHDPLLRRTARMAWPVRRAPWRIVRRLRLQGTDERVPSLAAALAALPAGLSMAIDIKDRAAAPATVDVVRRTANDGRVLLWSQHEEAVRWCARNAPEMECSLLRDAMDDAAEERFLRDAVDFGAKGISAHWDRVTPDFAERAASAGLRVYTWCQEEDRHAEKRGIPLAGVVTDWPRAARAALLPG
jgi:glycerophosphoryl diester phosphodiesterase